MPLPLDPEIATFLPPTFPDRDQLALEFSIGKDRYNQSPEPLRAYQQLNWLVSTYFNEYDSDHLPFSEAFERIDDNGNTYADCMTRAIMLRVTSYILDLPGVVSNIRMSPGRGGAEATWHAYNAARLPDSGNTAVMDGEEEVKNIPVEARKHGFAWHYLLKHKKVTTDAEGVYQIRYYGNTPVFRVFNRGVSQPIGRKVSGVETVFCGLEGLKSFIATAEKWKALKRGDEPPEIFAGQSVPNLWAS